jgi:hypothetical protein
MTGLLINSFREGQLSISREIPLSCPPHSIRDTYPTENRNPTLAAPKKALCNAYPTFTEHLGDHDRPEEDREARRAAGG